MARKKFYTYENKDANKKYHSQPFTWKVGLYIRLSREDGDKAVSNSIINQKKLLSYYVNDSEEFTDYEYFIDENVTGTNFNRPAFLRMVAKIKSGDINCVIVKDLSRFGRDYLGAGHYLENVFKEYACRFISIIDDIDSHIDKDMVMGLMVRGKNLAHDNNSQKISMSIRKTKEAMRKKGKYLARPPYGYLQDPDDKHHLIVDLKVANVIKDIFKWYIEGYGTTKIAQKLNELGISSKDDYRKTGDVNISDDTLIYRHWRPNTVRRVLENKVYMGAIVQNKYATANYKDRKKIYVPENEHVIVYDMHEPIIEKDIFNLAQEIQRKRCSKAMSLNRKVHMFAGYIKCADCGYAMLRNSTVRRGKEYAYYKCRTNNQQGISACNHNHSIREDMIYRTVLTVVNNHISTLISLEKIIREINRSKTVVNFSHDYDKAIKTKSDKIKKYKNLKYELYTSWKTGDISKDDYQFATSKHASMVEMLQKEKDQLEIDKTAEEDIRNNQFYWLEDVVEQGYLTELNRRFVVTLIDNIFISKDKDVKIVFRYADEFERLSSYANS